MYVTLEPGAAEGAVAAGPWLEVEIAAAAASVAAGRARRILLATS